MSDIIYQCKDCKQNFTFTEGEQAYYRDRGLAIPKRCVNCRLKRRNGKQSFNVSESPQIPKEDPKIPEKKKEEK